MIIRAWYFIFLLMAACSANAVTPHLFVVEKSFTEVQKGIKEYLSTTNYTVKERDDKIFEIYFDLPELSYLKQNGYIRYKAVQYLTKKKQKKKYIENIEYSLDGNSTYSFPVKHYNSVKTFEEKHPLLRLAKRKERQSFLDKLKQDGVEYPMRLKEIVQVSKLVHTFELSTRASKAGSIRINKIKASALNSETEFLMLEIDLKSNPTLINDLSIILGIQDKNNVDNEYAITFKQMKKNVSLFYWILRYPYLVNLLYGISYGFFGLLIVFFLFKKRFSSI